MDEKEKDTKEKKKKDRKKIGIGEKVSWNKKPLKRGHVMS